MNGQYIVVKHIDGKWITVGSYTSQSDAVDVAQADKNHTVAVYDQLNPNLISINIPNGSPLDTMLKLIVAKQIEANLAGKELNWPITF